MKKKNVKSFSTRWGFILASVGSAVGMANVWGFPNKMGSNGGGAFLCFLCVGKDGTNEESSLTHDHLTVQFQALVCMPIGSVTENRCDRIFITAGNNALRDIPAKDTSISIDLVFAFHEAPFSRNQFGQQK